MTVRRGVRGNGLVELRRREVGGLVGHPEPLGGVDQRPLLPLSGPIDSHLRGTPALHGPGILGCVPGRRDSDESYVLDLCDEVLRTRGRRQHRFDWLLGDPGKSGRRVRLPVDAYWPAEALVVEYRERQHEVPVRHFDKPERLTVSGVHRGEQRRIYDERRERSIPEHGLRLVIVKPDDLTSDSRGRLRRDRGGDLPAVRSILLAVPAE